MPRHTFGGGVADFTASLIGGVPHMQSAVVTFWTAKTGGVRLTDLLDETGTATMSISSHADGQIPPFSGPNDGTLSMWGDANGPERVLFVASDLGSYLPDNFLTADQINDMINQAVTAATTGN